jgi:hypothetical protein
MMASDGRYDEAIKLGLSATTLLFEDLQWGVGVQNVEAYLKRATSEQERQDMLSLCAAPVNPFVDDDSRPMGPLPYGREAEPPLDVAAGCAQRMAAPGWVGVVVALRAGRACRIDLMRELRERGIKTWRDQPTGMDPNL